MIPCETNLNEIDLNDWEVLKNLVWQYNRNISI